MKVKKAEIKGKISFLKQKKERVYVFVFLRKNREKKGIHFFFIHLIEKRIIKDKEQNFNY